MQKWEYKHLVMLWMPEVLVLENGEKLDWPTAWEHISELGRLGWEMISLTPVANQPIVSPTKETSTARAIMSGLWGGVSHDAGDTEVLLFVFKRPLE